MSGIHPCGNVPVSAFHITVWYCHYHQAYFAAHQTTHEDGGGDVQIVGCGTREFGPFDSCTDVGDWLDSWTDAIGLLPTAGEHVPLR